MASLRSRALVVFVGAFASFSVALAACSDLKAGGDGADASPETSPTSIGPLEPLADGALPDGALPDGAKPPTSGDASGDAQFQFDGGIVPRPTCVGNTSESWVPAPGCVPNAGPGRCTFTKVSRTCKNGSCQKGYCQELEFTVEQPSTPAKFVYQVWGAAPDAIWAVGQGVFFFNGTSWAPVDVGETFDNFTEAFAVAGTTRDDVTILTGNFNTGPMVLRRRDAGGTWRAVNSVTAAVWGGGLFALGQNRFIVHLGTAGAYYAAPGQTTFLKDLFGFPGSHHYTNALSGFKADDVLIASAGFDGTYFFNGSEAKKLGTNGGPPAHAVLYTPDVLGFLSVGSKVDLFDAVAGTRIGAQVDLPTTLSAPSSVWKGMDGTSADRMFVCAAEGVLARRDSTGTFSRVTVPTPLQMNAVFASPWGDVYVAGSRVWHGK